ncbi:MAG: VOC family protein [Planctomycetes bacterium]|nr:VOC family protein [Planctomycetota bacterium]
MSACCTPKVPQPEHALSSPKIHIHLHTTDLAASVTFYRAFFGEGPVKERPGYGKFLPSWAPVNLALSESPKKECCTPTSHFGIQVHAPALVRQHLKRVQEAGLQVRVEMGVECCHANQDKFWVRDPSGVEWEVYYLNFDLENQPHTAEKSSACCAR